MELCSPSSPHGPSPGLPAVPPWEGSGSLLINHAFVFDLWYIYVHRFLDPFEARNSEQLSKERVGFLILGFFF